MALIRAINVAKTYVKKNNEMIKAISNCNIEIEEGEFVIITGKPSAGKSTLLHLLGGYDRPSCGNVYMKHQDICTLCDRDRAKLYQQEIGLVLYDNQLLPGLTVYENIIMPSIFGHYTIERTFLDQITGSLHLKRILNNYPKHLTKEQKQCVVIIRTLVNKPKIILADEPMKDMDLPMSYEILDLLINYQKQSKCTLILGTRRSETSVFASHMIYLEQGRVVEDSKQYV